MASKAKRQEARATHQRNKRRARYKKVLNKYMFSEFNLMLTEVQTLNVKYLQQLLTDLEGGYISPWSGDYHRMLILSLESSILERTVLK